MATETLRARSPIIEAGATTGGLVTGQTTGTNPLSVLSGTDLGLSTSLSNSADNIKEIFPVADVILPFFMRSIPISFTGYNLRPNRRSFVYFDGKNVSSLVERPNIVELDNSNDYSGILNSTQSEYVNINYGIAKILHSEKNEVGNTILYLSSTLLTNTALSETLYSGLITPVLSGNTISSANVSTKLSNVVSYQHHSGYVRSGSNSTIIRLSTEASNVDDFYVGNTISIIGSSIPGRTANIVSYNGVSRVATVSPAFSSIQGDIGLIYTISDSRIKYSSSNNVSHFTTSKGFIAGVIHIPDPELNTEFKFRTGDRIITVTDSQTNQLDEATSYANFIFNAGGLQLNRQQIAFTPTQVTYNTYPDGRVKIGQDPTAQTFYVSEINYPDGIFVPFIDLFFANKGTQPIELQLRPVVNGYPDSKEIIAGAVAVVDSTDVRVSSAPNPNDPNTYTRFKFPSPVYLQSGREYAFVVITNDFDYDMYVSELGEKILGSDRVVSEQPYVGSLFKSQNSRTYTAIQSEDVMFVIHKCKFLDSGTVVFKERKDPFFKKIYTGQEADYKFDSFDYHCDYSQISNTSVNFSYKAITYSNSTMDISYTPFKPDITNLLPVRKVIVSDDQPLESFLVRMDLTTNNPDVSPIIYPDRQGLSTTRTIINDMSIDPSRIIIANTGNGYTTPNTSVTFTSNTGGGANATIITRIEPIFTGKIAGLNFDSFGSDYFEDTKITITSTDGNNANLIVQSELDPSGGPALSRYISKTVALTRGTEAGDLRVFLTAVRPPEANIQVYYKVRNVYDNDSIDNKRWSRMVQKIGTETSAFVPIELEFKPSLNSNNIIYSTNTATFDTFNEFKIKIVMSSSDTVFSKIPYIYDMIAVALPADSG
jgi:hypothetical protein